MRAIICDAFKRNTRHESIIFAIDYSFGWAHYYALNSEGKTIYILDESCLGPEDSLDFTVYMRNSDHPLGNWVIEEKIEGYDWFIKDKEILEKIRKCEPIDDEFAAKCLKQNKKELNWYRKHRNYNEIRNNNDIKDFFRFVHNFYLAGEITEFKCDYINRAISFRIWTPFFAYIILTFEEIRDISFYYPTFMPQNAEVIELYYVNNNQLCFECGGCYLYANKMSFKYKLNA